MLTKASVKTGDTIQLFSFIAPGNVCNMDYLEGITRGNEKTVKNLADAFVTEINENLAHLSIAIEKINYPEIGNIAHKMKSAFAILGIKVLEPAVKEMEQLSNMFSSIRKIKKISLNIKLIVNRALVEIDEAFVESPLPV